MHGALDVGAGLRGAEAGLCENGAAGFTGRRGDSRNPLDYATRVVGNVAKRAKEIQGLHDFRSWSAGSWRATSVKRRAAMRSTKFCARRRV